MYCTIPSGTRYQTGSSSAIRSRHSVDEIEKKLREDAEAKPVRREGEREGRWVLLDYADIIVHIQHEEDRVYYALERLWKDCPAVPLPDDVNPHIPSRAGR